MINIILSGCNGKMGRVISEAAKCDETVKIVAGFDINTEKNFDYPVYSDFDDINAGANVVIDFSHPANLEKVLCYCTKNNVAAVIATTGLTGEQTSKIYEAAKKIPVFFSANMSLGVNLLVSLAKQASRVLEDNFDIEIVEKHHNQKIDAPSGTALMIADEINKELKESCEYVYDRHLSRQKRSKNEIGIHSIRGGNIVGEHTVIFAGNDEIIEITHKAASKEVFAVGSIRAAQFLSGKGAGLYNMQDIMNL
ncbi:MAG: 4-hydroxy-tetrahydrodipicolinate reductase [Oscillospiraceae bacterium]|nr:4-hydroxy-tetrahydrodipicolinate reductase [Oscillospiraceae bacterium]